jgi:hypothetical protein
MPWNKFFMSRGSAEVGGMDRAEGCSTPGYSLKSQRRIRHRHQVSCEKFA